MPSLIVSSPSFAQSGIALSASSCTEQVNGLVEVSATYSILGSQQSRIDALFYVDAPPPIHPSCINRANLLTNRLYMKTRSVSASNGICTVTAQYVGALVRQGFVGYYLTEQLDQKVQTFNIESALIAGGGNAIIISGGLASVQTNIRYDTYQITVEFMQVGDLYAATPPQITSRDLIRNFRATNPTFVGGVETPAPTPFIGSFGMFYDEWLYKSQSPNSQESFAYLTPTVRVVSVKHAL